MGSFDATCAVSRLAISSGDEVMYILPEDKWVNSTYELLNHIYRRESIKSMEPREDATDEEKKFIEWKKIRDTLRVRWGFGKYNDYGWIEGDEFPEGRFDSIVLIRKSVAEKVASMMDASEGDFLRRLVKSCYLMRIQLFGNNLLGEQYCTKEEVERARVLNGIIAEEIDFLEEEQRRWE